MSRRTSHVALCTSHVTRHTSLQVAADVCSLVAALSGPHGVVSDAVEYASDGWSVHLAMSSAGIFTALPVSPSLLKRYPCLSTLAPKHVIPSFPSKMLAYHWALQSLLPFAAADIVFNADFYPRSDVPQFMLLSADYPVRQRAFVMNIDACWYMVDQPPCNASQVEETGDV